MTPLARPPRTVALVLMSAIGDVVHGLPLVASLREAWPEVEIDWIIQAAAHGLVASHPDVARFHLFRRELGARAFPALWRRLAESRPEGRRFDLVLDPQVYLKAGLATWMLDAPVKLGFDRRRARDLNWLFTTHRIPPHEPQHVQDQYFEFLEWLGVPVVRRWEFHLTEREREAQEAFFGRLDRPALAVVLRTTRPGKDWILERYARVLEIAERELGFRSVIVGSEAPAEVAAAREVLARTRAEPVVALENDLRKLVWLLEGSAALLSPDTGPLHIAVALGTPTVGLYGYTDPKRVGPYRRFGDLVVDRYSRPGETLPSSEFRPGGMDRITVAEVAEKLSRVAERRSTDPRSRGTDV